MASSDLDLLVYSVAAWETRVCRPHTCVGFLSTLQLPPTDQKHAHEVDGESKLPHDMSVGVSCGCAPRWKQNCLHFLPLVFTK